jgi:DNA-binding LytR/AlgR family response regulator
MKNSKGTLEGTALKVAIVDDEPHWLSVLSSYLKRYGQEHDLTFTVSYYQNGAKFLEEYRCDCDIVLMDIEMPGIDGMRISQQLRKLDGEVSLIFITRMAQYALQGYDVQARYFLVKPISYNDFAFKLTATIQWLKQQTDGFILVNAENATRKVPLNSIYYIEVVKHCMILHTTDGEIEQWNKPLKDMEAQLAPYNFVRCSSGFLINLKYIQRVQGNSVFVADREIPISRNKKAEFLSALVAYVGRTV